MTSPPLDNLSDFLSAIERAGELVRVTQPVSVVREVTEIADRCMKSPGGGPALLFWTGGTLFMVGGFRIADGQIHGIYAILNPDKLAYLQRQLRKRNHTRSVAP